MRFNQLLEGDLVADPINVFVKREPIKSAKEKVGAYRLISGVSLIDCLVDRVIFGWLLRQVLSTVNETPCMVGWSPMRGGWRRIRQIFKDGPVVCLDKSAWDWTVVEWMIYAFEQFILDLPINAPEWWQNMVKARIRLLYRDAVFQFQDGTTLKQGLWGIQKSGSLLTIIFNSVLQYVLHVVAGGDPDDKIVIVGDDTAQKAVADLAGYIKRIEAVGPKVKPSGVKHWVEFAGFCFVGNSFFPAYWAKHLYNLKYTRTAIETLQSYQLIYAHEPIMWRFVEEQLASLDPTKVRTRRECLEVVNECYPTSSLALEN